jgi:hypothetical protein
VIPPVTDALIPAHVREEGGADTYEAALGFESMLLDKLTEDLIPTSGPYGAQVGDAFSDALLQGGGIGLAEDLYFGLRSSQAPPFGRRHA